MDNTVSHSVSEAPLAPPEAPPDIDLAQQRRDLMHEFAALYRTGGLTHDRRKSQQLGTPAPFGAGWPHGDGGIATRLREGDWTASYLGSPQAWPSWLRVACGFVLELPMPAVLLVGPALIQVFNDACASTMAQSHYLVLGEPIAATSESLWLRDSGVYKRVLEQGATMIGRGRLHPRNTLSLGSHSAVRDERGAIRGVLWLPTVPN